jgi:hypothetical protein
MEQQLHPRGENDKVGKGARSGWVAPPFARAVASPASEPLRDQSGVKYAIFVPSTCADHSITVFNLASINIVGLLAAMFLANP